MNQKTIKKSTLILVSVFLSLTLTSQNIELSNKLISQFKAGKLKATQLHNLKTTQRGTISHDYLWLSPILRDAVLNWDVLTPDAKTLFKFYADRPEFTGTEKTFVLGNFKFHYTTDGVEEEKVDVTDSDANGTPDYVENMARKFVADVYAKYHTTLGLTVPPGDGAEGGDSKYDIYISGSQAGDGVYGYVSPEMNLGDNPNSASVTESEAYTSFMVMRNNYVGFGNDQNKALSVTSAHEYMHATQMGYTANMASWFMEVGATWSEEYVFPGYDDNFQYLMDLYGKTDVALNLEDGEESGTYDSHWYSSWIFAQFMTEHTGNNIIKNIYQRSVAENIMEAIDNELKTTAWNSSFQTLFTQFTVANGLMTSNAAYAPYTYRRASDYRTYITDNGGFIFENGSTPLNFTGSALTWNSQTDGNNKLMRLSSDYFKFTTDRNFRIKFNAASAEARLILVKTNSSSVSIEYCNANDSVNVTDYSNWSSIIPIVVRFDLDLSSTDALNYSLSIDNLLPSNNPTNVSEPVIEKVKFITHRENSQIQIEFSRPMANDAELRVYNLSGQMLIHYPKCPSQINTRVCNPGIYFIELLNKGERYLEKIILSK